MTAVPFDSLSQVLAKNPYWDAVRNRGLYRSASLGRQVQISLLRNVDQTAGVVSGELTRLELNSLALELGGLVASPTSRTLAESALEYVAIGTPVFPLRPRSKMPATSHGFKDASTDLEQVRTWWEQTPDANIGLSVGDAGWLVIDVDGLQGMRTFEELTALLGDLPETRKHKTGRLEGGYHLIFRRPCGIELPGKLGPNVDLKRDGGYIVAPPSIHPDSGAPYTVENDAPIVDLPEAWIDYLLEPAREGTNSAWKPPRGWDASASMDIEMAQMLEEPVFTNRWTRKGVREELARFIAAPRGTRNHTLFVVACRLFEHRNAGHVDPDWIDASLAAAVAVVFQDEPDEIQAARATLISAERNATGRAEPPLDVKLVPIGESLEVETLDPDASVDGNRLRITPLLEIEHHEVGWLLPGRIPFGYITALEGHTSVGKSLVAYDLMARATNGDHMPDGSQLDELINVLIFTEDISETMVKPRLAAALADQSKVFILHPEVEGGDGRVTAGFSIDKHCQLLDEAMTKHAVRLVLIDPFVLATRVDLNDYGQISQVLKPLTDVMAKHNAACLLVRHFNKSASNVRSAGMGSAGFLAACRAQLICGPDPDDESMKVLGVGKANLASEGTASLRYRIVGSSDSNAPRIEWTGESPHSGDGLMGLWSANSDTRTLTKKEEARGLIVDRLLKREGNVARTRSIRAKLMLADASHLDISKSTLDRASKGLVEKVKRYKDHGGGIDYVEWVLTPEFLAKKTADFQADFERITALNAARKDRIDPRS